MSLSDYIGSEYTQQLSLQNFTGKTLSDFCSMLAELISEMELSSLVIIGTSRSQEAKHFLHHSVSLFSTAKQVLVLSQNREFDDRCKYIELNDQDPLLNDWFAIVYSPEFAYMLVTKTLEEVDLHKISTLLTYNRTTIALSIRWLLGHFTNHEDYLQIYTDFEELLEQSKKTEPEVREKVFCKALERISFNLNRLPAEHERIEQEMEATLYKLAISNSELAVLNTMLELISRSLDLQEIYGGLLKAVEVVDLDAAVILLFDSNKRLYIDFYGGATLEIAE
ncbi:MAG: hypothetical protein JNN15_08385, partial [Blastocatellia bacterium]|nr:hypothetical protein [Blastocatellia bacterium]